MRLMAGVTRCLLLCIMLLLPAIVASQAPPPPPPPPSPFPDLSCTELFGNAPEFVLCEETETTCSFNARMDGGTCDQLCASFGSTCLGAIPNSGESCEELPDNTDTCETSRSTEICICERPEDTTTPPPPPDTPPPPDPEPDPNQSRIEELEQWILDHPGVFDWNVHNELRHLYLGTNPPDLRKSMEHANVILQHSVMDGYILNILSGWQIGVDSAAARDNLLMNAESYPDLRFIAAACFLKIGDLYTEEGNLEEAESFYLRVAEDTSPDMAQYRKLAEERGTETTLILTSVGTFNGEAAPEQAGPQTSFAPGEAIRYAARIKNTGSSTMTASLDYLVTGPKEIFSSIEDIAIPPDPPEGGWSLYVTTTVPTDAPSGTYTLQVTMTINGQSSTKESSFTVLGGSEQPPAAISRIPEGKAPNLVVLVHGCCTDANDVRNIWENFGRHITGTIQTPGTWEIVVLDWTLDTPKSEPFWSLANAITAYGNAEKHRIRLAHAIANHSYKYVHLIGHSAGAKLIDSVAEELSFIYANSTEPPFIHLTFLDAFTPFITDWLNYGSLGDYPHYSEHYVHRLLPLTDGCLPNAFNFDITGWGHSPEEDGFAGHHWPIYWYQKSVAIPNPMPEFSRYGYPLSFEGGNVNYNALSGGFPKGIQCSLSENDPNCEAAVCWVGY